jgi:hypothetical protein
MFSVIVEKMITESIAHFSDSGCEPLHHQPKFPVVCAVWLID